MTDARQTTLPIRLVVGLLLAALVVSCSGSDEPNTVWDFRDPVTGFDLGGTSADFASFDEPGEMLTVILPAGQRLELDPGVDAYRSDFFGDNPAPGVLDQVLYALAPPGDADQLRSAVTEFTAQWGAAISAAGDDQTATEYVAELDDNIDNADAQSSVRFFEAVTDAGEVVKIGIGTTGDGQWNAGVTLSFRPPTAGT